MQLRYIDIEKVSKFEFQIGLEQIPEAVKKDVLQYRFFKNQKQKLFGRLFIQSYFSKMGKFDWNNLQYTSSGKPFVHGGIEFNLSHSGNKIVIIFSKHQVGIDIEKISDIDIKGMTDFFHPNEKKHIRNSSGQRGDFYKIWTRKEAFLKAKGIGVVNSLSQYDCTENQVVSSNDIWHIRNFNLMDNYQIAICQNSPIGSIKIEETNTNQILNQMKK